MPTVDVIIATYSDLAKWTPLAKRAEASAKAQTASCGVVWQHGHTLAQARNEGARQSMADYLIFLDADDELDPYYVEAMLREQTHDHFVSPGHSPSQVMLWPSTIGVYEDGHTDDYPVLLQPRGSLLVHNWMVIGTMVPRNLFEQVRGFRELPILEDWDLWIRIILAGADPYPCEKALYRVHVRPNSRNNPDIHGYTYTEIQQLYTAEWRARGLP